MRNVTATLSEALWLLVGADVDRLLGNTVLGSCLIGVV
jgi:hypothetical protein